MLLCDELEATLAEFDPWMKGDTVRQVIERLEAIPPTIEGNREMLSRVKGERQWYNDIRTKSVTGRCRLSTSTRRRRTPFTSPGNGP
jgi:hypothetical protein